MTCERVVLLDWVCLGPFSSCFRRAHWNSAYGRLLLLEIPLRLLSWFAHFSLLGLGRLVSYARCWWQDKRTWAPPYRAAICPATLVFLSVVGLAVCSLFWLICRLVLLLGRQRIAALLPRLSPWGEECRWCRWRKVKDLVQLLAELNRRSGCSSMLLRWLQLEGSGTQEVAYPFYWVYWNAHVDHFVWPLCQTRSNTDLISKSSAATLHFDFRFRWLDLVPGSFNGIEPCALLRTARP